MSRSAIMEMAPRKLDYFNIVELAIHRLLFAKKVYPYKKFKKVMIKGFITWICKVPKARDNIKDLLKCVQLHLGKERLLVAMLTFNENSGFRCERYIFQMNDYRLDAKRVEEMLEIISQIEVYQDSDNQFLADLVCDTNSSFELKVGLMSPNATAIIAQDYKWKLGMEELQIPFKIREESNAIYYMETCVEGVLLGIEKDPKTKYVTEILIRYKESNPLPEVPVNSMQITDNESNPLPEVPVSGMQITDNESNPLPEVPVSDVLNDTENNQSILIQEPNTDLEGQQSLPTQTQLPVVNTAELEAKKKLKVDEASNHLSEKFKARRAKQVLKDSKKAEELLIDETMEKLQTRRVRESPKAEKEKNLLNAKMTYESSDVDMAGKSLNDKRAKREKLRAKALKLRSKQPKAKEAKKFRKTRTASSKLENAARVAKIIKTRNSNSGKLDEYKFVKIKMFKEDKMAKKSQNSENAQNSPISWNAKKAAKKAKKTKKVGRIEEYRKTADVKKMSKSNTRVLAKAVLRKAKKEMKKTDKLFEEFRLRRKSVKKH